jgi:quercetin dioxygenase-like cupin family protein
MEKFVVNAKDIKPLELDGMFGGAGKFLRFPLYAETEAPPFTVIAEREMAAGARVGLHTQADQQELLYVLSGSGNFSIDGEMRAVKAGDACLARAGTNFGLHNIGDTPLRYLVVKCRTPR